MSSSSNIPIPEIHPRVIDNEQISEDVIRISLSIKEITELFSGKEYVHESIGHPKIIITKIWEN